MGLDAQDSYMHGCHHLERVVFVHLGRTHQFRNHVLHLRKPFATGSLVECTRNKTMWKPAIIAKIVLDKIDRVYFVELNGREVVVSGSSIRQCFPAKSQVSEPGGFGIV